MLVGDFQVAYAQDSARSLRLGLTAHKVQAFSCTGSDLHYWESSSIVSAFGANMLLHLEDGGPGLGMQLSAEGSSRLDIEPVTVFVSKHDAKLLNGIAASFIAAVPAAPAAPAPAAPAAAASPAPARMLPAGSLTVTCGHLLLQVANEFHPYVRTQRRRPLLDLGLQGIEVALSRGRMVTLACELVARHYAAKEEPIFAPCAFAATVQEGDYADFFASTSKADAKAVSGPAKLPKLTVRLSAARALEITLSDALVQDCVRTLHRWQSFFAALAASAPPAAAVAAAVAAPASAPTTVVASAPGGAAAKPVVAPAAAPVTADPSFELDFEHSLPAIRLVVAKRVGENRLQSVIEVRSTSWCIIMKRFAQCMVCLIR